MARISKADHPTILRMVDVDNRRVADVAVEFGCTPANIYTLLVKLRRAGQDSARRQAPLVLELDDAPDVVAPEAMPSPSSAEGPIKAAEATSAPSMTSRSAWDTGEIGPVPLPQAEDTNVYSFDRAQPAPKVTGAPQPAAKLLAPAPRPATRASDGSASKIGAKLAKPGVGLLMRTADGEDSLTPFRSLDDLLSAIKPILRASARSPEPVWFSLQPVDLSTIEVDAA
jgi:hypothetical protein